MKKVFLVKKNPNMPESEDNWIMMNSYEFAMFIKTEEGQRRKNNFAPLDACSEEDDIYVVECGEERAKKWRSEKDAHDYLKECEAESGIETISFDSVEVDGEELSLEEVVADPNSDFLTDLIRKLEHEKLMHILETLPLEEYAIIHHLYLSETPISERTLARKMNLPQKTLNNRKLQIFARLKKLIEN